jgi:hypothetical protein
VELFHYCGFRFFFLLLRHDGDAEQIFSLQLQRAEHNLQQLSAMPRIFPGCFEEVPSRRRTFGWLRFSSYWCEDVYARLLTYVYTRQSSKTSAVVNLAAPSRSLRLHLLYTLLRLFVHAGCIRMSTSWISSRAALPAASFYAL